MKKLLILSIFLIGCNRKLPADPRDIHGIDPAFMPYVQQFESILGASIGDIPIQFVKQQGEVVGECVFWGSQWKEIKVDPDFWATGALDNDERMALLFHELGHCVLGRGHLNTEWTYTNNYGPWAVPVSFMNAYIFFSDYPPYPDLKAYYINELFHPAPGYPTLNQTQDEEVHYTDTKSIFNHKPEVL